MSTSQKQQKGSTVKLVDLTPDEVKRLPRPREGFEPYAVSLVQLYEANADALGKGFDANAMRNALAAYQALDANLASARKQLEMIEETRLLHASAVWTAMLDIYARVRAASRNDVALQRAVADFAQYLKPHARKQPSTAPSAPPSPVPATSTTPTV